MTSVELIELVATELKIKKSLVANVVQVLIDEMTMALRQGKAVKFKGYGTFKMRTLKPKNMFGNEVQSRKVVKLKVGRNSPWRSSE